MKDICEINNISSILTLNLYKVKISIVKIFDRNVKLPSILKFQVK